jgi:hypothetical protein
MYLIDKFSLTIFRKFAGVFPEADKDPVIQIANMVIRQGEHAPFIRNVFTLNTCAPVIGSQVLSYMTEKEMLSVSYKQKFEKGKGVYSSYLAFKLKCLT